MILCVSLIVSSISTNVCSSVVDAVASVGGILAMQVLTSESDVVQ